MGKGLLYQMRVKKLFLAVLGRCDLVLGLVFGLVFGLILRLFRGLVLVLLRGSLGGLGRGGFGQRLEVDLLLVHFRDDGRGHIGLGIEGGGHFGAVMYTPCSSFWAASSLGSFSRRA